MCRSDVPVSIVNVLSRENRRIDGEEDVGLVRHAVRLAAEQHGFDVFAVAALTTAVSELARNIWRHAGTGTAIICVVTDAARTGIRVELRDEGRGIADVKNLLAGGEGAGRDWSLGLPGSARLVDDLEIDSVAGGPTVVTILKWRRS